MRTQRLACKNESRHSFMAIEKPNPITSEPELTQYFLSKIDFLNKYKGVVILPLLKLPKTW